MKKLIMIALLMLMTVSIHAQVPVTYVWTAPTTGTPAETYVVQLKTDDGAWVQVATVSDTTFTLVDIEYNRTYLVRVAGKDALDRVGPWSDASDPYIPDRGAPGACGKPVIRTI